MLSNLLYQSFSYQIFKSVFFRGGMTFLTTFFFVTICMPYVIRLFRRQGITSDFSTVSSQPGPYSGATPIMGGIILIPAILLSTILWVWINSYVITLILIILLFAIIGGLDDAAKVFHKRRVESGKETKKGYSDKADGISGKIRISLEIVGTFFIISGLYYYGEGIDGHIHIPMIPMKTLFPDLGPYLMIPFIVLIIVGGANAVNLTDGLDTLATVPMITCTVFVAAAAYISGDVEWSERLKLIYLSDQIKEVTVFSIAVIAACGGFLKFNSPPASIYMGDIASLGLGAVISTMFCFIKAELYLPIVGGIFVIAAISVILQRLWFKVALLKKGRAWAEKNRLFYRAPYHHHRQALLTYDEQGSEIRSVWHDWMLKIGVQELGDEDKFRNRDQVNNKVIWNSHLRSVFLLVVTLIIFFKVR